MLVHAPLVGNLMRDELRVVPRCYALIYDLVLLHALLDSRVYELRHLDVVCEHVERYVAALGYGDELLLVVVVVSILLILSIHVERICRSRAFERSNRLDKLFHMHVVFEVTHH